MKKTFGIIAICLFALLLVGVVSCPDEQAHKNAIQQEFNEFVNDSFDEDLKPEDSDFEKGLVLMGRTFASNIIETVMDNSIKVNNYFVFSTAEMPYNGKKITVSVGFLGHVFVGNIADNLKEEFNKTKQEPKTSGR